VFAGFPGTINASINEEVVHGVPSEKRILKEGDIFSIDIGMLRNGFVADMATTVPVGEVSDEARRILEVGERSLWEGIKQVRIGHRLSDISHAIGSFVEKEGYHVVREYVTMWCASTLDTESAGPYMRIPRFRTMAHRDAASVSGRG